jgi:tetratricopeptide (TPR) repeat protein
MKLLLLAGCSIIIVLMGYTGTKNAPGKIDSKAKAELIVKKRSSAIRCTPDWTTYRLSKLEILQMMPLPGTGSHKWKISTKNDSAQFYFNQGINLYYGFHIIEAMPSFKKAQTFDPACAMLYWAEALAYGPNINDFGYAASPDALAATQKAKELSATSSLKEKVLIEAMQVRYSNDTTQKREALNQLYADKMNEAYTKFPADAEIGALYADALMIQHPWDLWGHDWQPRPWTPQIQKVLENVLKRNPDHPGANHYYIHTMEASPNATKALASADRLGRLAPGLAHMVHMPSHIYIRTGQYEKGVKVNKSAVERYKIYSRLFPDVGNNAFLYEIHNRHMQAACSMNRNDYPAALADAIECRNSFDTSLLSMEPPLGDFIQYVYMTPELTMVTFEKWEDIIEQPNVQTRLHYASLLQHFARGMAYANTNNLKKAKGSLTALESLLYEKDLAVVFSPFNAPLTSANIARYILKGTIAEKENNTDKSIEYFKKAVVTEDSLVYNEPRDWLVPARHFLGNALSNAKKFKEAEKVFREDLKVQPNNFLSTRGLQAVIVKQKTVNK